jgi:hypothetical protein
MIEQYGIRAGSVIPMNIEELEVAGTAIVRTLRDCPAISVGQGNVVTGRYVTREASTKTRVEILGEDGTREAIEGTPQHPIWTVDRSRWVGLQDLVEGETLVGETGFATVLSVSTQSCSEPVYNLEIHGEHVYQVGKLGILVHNAVSCPTCTVAPVKTASESLPQFKGMSEAQIRKKLQESGYTQTHVSNSAARNEKWNHPDGSEVRIHPYGNAQQAPYKTANNAHVHKEDPLGRQLNDRGLPSTIANETHIGIPNPRDLPQVRGRPHGAGTQ